jgi:ribonuclease HI
LWVLQHVHWGCPCLGQEEGGEEAVIIVYTDGSYFEGRGGWAWWHSEHMYDSGQMIATNTLKVTNNTMEMVAVIEAMKCPHFDADERMMIVSDSAYVVEGMNAKWFEKWETNGWRNSSNKQVKNLDLWKELIHLHRTRSTPVFFRHVRGHGRGSPERVAKDAIYKDGNHHADRLAGAARKINTTVAPPKRVRPQRKRPGAEPTYWVPERGNWERDVGFCGP